MRKLTKMQDINRGDRSLIESVMNPEVIFALRDWVKSIWMPRPMCNGRATGADDA
jgi:hypothetical protein